MNTNRLLILGVPASGKGWLGFDLAKHLDAEIISIDSIKVLRRMDIGTAKPPKEARQRIKYHLIDIVEPSDSFSVGAFIEAASDAMEQINSRKKKIVAVGGTALYIKSLLYGLFDGAGTDEHIRTELRARAEAEGLAELHREVTKIDPAAAERINPKDARRIVRALEVYQLTGKPISSFQKQWQQRQMKHDWTIIGLRREKADASSRINRRVKKMIDAGLVDEAGIDHLFYPSVYSAACIGFFSPQADYCPVVLHLALLPLFLEARYGFAGKLINLQGPDNSPGIFGIDALGGGR